MIPQLHCFGTCSFNENTTKYLHNELRKVFTGKKKNKNQRTTTKETLLCSKTRNLHVLHSPVPQQLLEQTLKTPDLGQSRVWRCTVDNSKPTLFPEKKPSGSREGQISSAAEPHLYQEGRRGQARPGSVPRACSFLPVKKGPLGWFNSKAPG